MCAAGNACKSRSGRLARSAARSLARSEPIRRALPIQLATPSYLADAVATPTRARKGGRVYSPLDARLLLSDANCRTKQGSLLLIVPVLFVAVKAHRSPRRARTGKRTRTLARKVMETLFCFGACNRSSSFPRPAH